MGSFRLGVRLLVPSGVYWPTVTSIPVFSLLRYCLGAELHHALQEGGRSANTIRQAKVVLGAMFGMAVADGYLDYNPFHDVKIPKVPGRRARALMTAEGVA
jgi:hypothetical protein